MQQTFYTIFFFKIKIKTSFKNFDLPTTAALISASILIQLENVVSKKRRVKKSQGFKKKCDVKGILTVFYSVEIKGVSLKI